MSDTSSPTPWAALLPAALAGTHRQPFAPMPGFTPALGHEADAAEKQLLLTAANLALVQRAGRRPLPGPADNLGHAPAETLPPLPPAAVALLRELEISKSLHSVVGSCMALTRGYRLAHHDLANLFAGLPAGRYLRLLFRSWLGGRRGEWLLAWHPEGQQPEEHYPHPPPSGQRADLHRLAERRPPGGWPWLLAEWAAASPEQRLVLLRVLDGWTTTEALPPAFYPLVEAQAVAMQAPPLSQLGSKAYWLGDARYPEALAQVPGSPLLEPHWTRARQLLTWEPGAPHLTVTLPDYAAPTWDAYDQDAYYHEAARPQWLLHEVLAWVPPSRWAATWHLTLPEAVALAAASPHAHWLLNAWLVAATRYRDQTALRALLALPPWPEIYPRAGCNYNYHVFLEALEQLPEAEEVAWRLKWLPALPHAPLPLNQYGGRQTPDWLDWASYYHWWRRRPPLSLQLGLVTFMGDYLALPAGTASPDPNCPVERDLAKLLREQLGKASLPLVAAIETQLLPLARAQPARPLGEAVLESWTPLTFYRTLAATLATPPAA